VAAEILAGRRVAIRVEQNTLMFFDPDWNVRQISPCPNVILTCYAPFRPIPVGASSASWL
jgi:hypothetical protein